MLAGSPPESDERQYLGIARSIHSTGEFRLHGETTAWRPPLYPFFLSGCLNFSESPWVPRAIQLLMSLAMLEMGAFILVALGASPLVVGVFLAFGALSPAWAWYPTRLLSETLFGFLLIAALALLVRAILESDRRRLFLGLGAGVLFGLATLTRSTLLFFPPALAVACVLFRARGKLLSVMLLVVLGWGLALFPWTLRNFLVFDAFIPVNTMKGVVLWSGLHPPEEGFGFVPHEEIDRITGTHDELARDRILTEKSIAEMRADPQRAVRLGAIKVLWFLNPWDGDSYALGSPFNPHTFVWLALCGLGVLLAWRVPRSPVADDLSPEQRSLHRFLVFLLVSLILYCVALSALFYGSPRFRMPVDPILWMGASFGVARLVALPRWVREPIVVLLIGSLIVLYTGGNEFKIAVRDLMDVCLGYEEVFR